MAEALLAAAGLAFAATATGLLRVLRGPTEADRMMAAQLLGTGGIATLLLLAAGSGRWAVLDVALALAVLAAFASVAFALAAGGRRG
jgi:multicomponent Na+:H+ antiporter subunit F